MTGALTSLDRMAGRARAKLVLAFWRWRDRRYVVDIAHSTAFEYHSPPGSIVEFHGLDGTYFVIGYAWLDGGRTVELLRRS